MRPVVWSDDAQRDYLDTLRFIAADNPNAAERVAAAIAQTADDLGLFATGRPGRMSGVYEKPVGRLPYIVAYTLTVHGARECVTILRVIHTARDWPDGGWPE